MWNKIKNYLIVILAVIIAIFYAYVKIQLKINQKQQDKIEVLDENLQRVCTIANNLLIEKFRNSQGKVEVRRTYLPPEGKTTVAITNKGDVVVKVKKVGFCFKPGIITLLKYSSGIQDFILSEKSPPNSHS